MKTFFKIIQKNQLSRKKYIYINKNNNMNKQVIITIDDSLWQKFIITINVLNKNSNEVLESLIHDYCIINKVNVNEYVNEFWGLKNNQENHEESKTI